MSIHELLTEADALVVSKTEYRNNLD